MSPSPERRSPPGSGGDSSWMDAAPWGFVLAEPDGRILHANPTLAGWLGQVAPTLEELASPGKRPVVAVILARLSQGSESERVEIECQAHNGSLIPLEWHVVRRPPEADGSVGRIGVFLKDLQVRKQHEKALQRSERRFQDIFDEAPFGYHEIDTEGTILRINRTECEMLGYAREDVLGSSVFDFVAPAMREAARASVREKVAGIRPLSPLERTFVTRDGRELIVAIDERLIRDDFGKVQGIRTIVRDITEKKQAEAALIASERRARMLFEGIEDAVFVHALDGTILDANPAACRRLGYTRDEMLRLNTREIDDPEFAKGFEERRRSQLSEGRLSCEGRHRTKHGRVVPVDINSALIDYEGRPAVLAVMRDLTERNALEETRRAFLEAQVRHARALEENNRALISSEARYRQLTEASLDAVVVSDESGRIILFNPSAEKTFGYAADEALGMTWTNLVTGGLPEPHAETFRTYLETRSPRLVGRTLELRGRRKSGETFPLELAMTVVDQGGRSNFLGAIRDLTERQKMREMIIRSEKLASIGLLSAGVAHEINNPLAYIGNNLAVLERDLKGVAELIGCYESAESVLRDHAPEAYARACELSEEIDWPYVRENLPRILLKTREGVKRVADIIQSLRGLARTTPPRNETVSVQELLSNPLEMIRGRLRKNDIDLRLEGDHGLRLACVPTQLSQVLLNLLVNAVQAIESLGRGGRIVVRADRGSDPDREDVTIEVSDTGGGIDPQHLPMLFDPFFTTKPVGEGTGLGLSICHEIVRSHGGRIEVRSHPGEGTSFLITLPCRPDSPTGSATEPRP